MADYKQTTITGSSWQRAKRVIVTNPRDAIPTISFEEEKVYVLGDQTMSKDCDHVVGQYDSLGQIPLIDPTTGLATGEAVTQATLYQILYSLYMQLAVARDAIASQLEQ